MRGGKGRGGRGGKKREGREGMKYIGWKKRRRM